MQQLRRVARVRESGWLERSVVTVRDINGLVLLEKDEIIKPNSTMEVLSQLKPSFEGIGKMGYDDIALRKYPAVERINHVHTPGNSSGIVDGASAVLIGNEIAVRDLKLTPRGRIVSTAVLATDPTLMLAGPGPAAKKCLAKAGMTTKDIDLFEINEAFSSVVLRFMRDMEIPHEITNV